MRKLFIGTVMAALIAAVPLSFLASPASAATNGCTVVAAQEQTVSVRLLPPPPRVEFDDGVCSYVSNSDLRLVGYECTGRCILDFGPFELHCETACYGPQGVTVQPGTVVTARAIQGSASVWDILSSCQPNCQHGDPLSAIA